MDTLGESILHSGAGNIALAGAFQFYGRRDEVNALLKTPLRLPVLAAVLHLSFFVGFLFCF
jgi:hypothetical protein